MIKKEFFEQPRQEYINKTEQWSLTDRESLYLKAKEESKTLYDKDDFNYKYNNYGFRCEDFDSWTNHPYRVLFAGCSLPAGVGLPVEASWPKIVHTTLCEKFNITMPYWNIAAGGIGTDQIATYLYHVGDLIRPQVIISSLPDLNRRERWTDDLWSIWGLDKSKNTVFKDRSMECLIDERFVTYLTEKNFAFIDLMLEKWNTKFIIVNKNNNNESFNLDVLSQVGLNNFVRVNDPLPDPVTFVDWARDGLHAGPIVTKKYAEDIYSLIEPIIKQHLGL